MAEFEDVLLAIQMDNGRMRACRDLQCIEDHETWEFMNAKSYGAEELSDIGSENATIVCKTLARLATNAK
jgi:hypothetical protein